MISTSKLFSPFNLGQHKLQHRVVLAPLTRCRASEDNVHGDIAVDYYSQRASSPGTLLITEGTYIAPAGMPNVPGIWNSEQINSWKKVTEAVHAKRCFIFMQLWTLGRAATPYSESLKTHPLGPFDVVSSSAIPLSNAPDGAPAPRPLTITEIKDHVGQYAKAAANAMAAGFDGVEIHSANGYLLDQFVQDVCNQRSDEYGGSIENRSKFVLDVIQAVVDTVGQDKTAVRFSPWSKFQDMQMADPVPQFSYLVNTIKEKYPDFAYLSMIEPRVKGDFVEDRKAPGETNDPFRAIWFPKTFISAGGYSPEQAAELSEERPNELVAFGRHFLSNPDLVQRLQFNIPLADHNRETFYYPPSASGYSDYPFASNL